MGGRRRAERGGVSPMPGRHVVSSGEAELLRDLDRHGGWVLTVDGVPQSYVDLDDPTYLDFEYVKHMGDVIDCVGEEGAPLEVVHVGGGACTLPRYVAVTRPGSRQIVIEPDGALVELVREQLRLSSVPRLRVRVTDGRSGVARIREDFTDLLVVDAFQGASIPPGVITVEFVRDAARVLRPGGVYLLNVADGPGLLFTRRVVATVAEVFPEVVMIAAPGILRGRRFGNLIVGASTMELPVTALLRRTAGGVAPARCVYGDDLVRFRGSAAPLRDGEEIIPPKPPDAVFGRPSSWT